MHSDFYCYFGPNDFINFIYLEMNIFVAKLSYQTTSETLEQVFAQYGEVVSAKVIMDRETGRSKGFGFVEMPNEEEGNQAISQLDNTELDSRQIVVKEARPREERPSFGNRPRGGGDYRRGNDSYNRGNDNGYGNNYNY